MISQDLFCTVVSLVPFEINESKPGLFPSHYHIDESDTIKPKVIHVGTAAHFAYLDETRGSLRIPAPSTTVASSVVNDFINGQLNVSEECYPGLFWVPGKLTAEEVEENYESKLNEVRKCQFNWLTSMCRLADDDFTRYQKHNVVSDTQRRAAKLIGWEPKEHPWMRQGREMSSVTCKGCGSVVTPGVAVCICGVILDKALYETLEFVGGKRGK